MSEFDKPVKYKVVKKGLKKLGLAYSRGSKHDVAECPKTGNSTTIPRGNKELNKYTFGSICEFLVTNGYSKKDIKDKFNL